MGLASEERMFLLNKKMEGVENVRQVLENTNIEPTEIESYLNSVYSAPLVRKQKASQVLLRPNIDIAGIMENIPTINNTLNIYEDEVLEQAEIQLKYETYIETEKQLVKKMSLLEDLLIPDNFNFDKINSLSTEARQKFARIRPRTLGQASRISGVNPSDVQILMVFMGR
jgi:tRNA uridine 5-carboxymethylaminomethyl modification enzyme